MEKDVKIAPSILSADFANLGAAVAEAEAAGADIIHLDVMDGQFVPNITIGPLVVEAVRRITQLPLGVHLMIDRPERYLEDFARAGADTLVVHPEASVHLHRTLSKIHDLGVEAGVALNPSTSEDVLRYSLPFVDEVLIMTVNPGFGGQAFIPEMLPKISRVRQMLADAGRPACIAVDGGIDSTTAPLVVAAGANLLVAGSAVFRSPEGVARALANLKASVL